MPDWLPAKIVDSVIPEIVDRITAKWVLHAVFWPSLILIAVPVTLQNGVAGAVFVAATALIVLCTAWVGLARVHLVVWLPGAAFILAAALILGQFQARLDRGYELGGWAFVAFVVFLVCITSFTALLAAIDRDRRKKLSSDDAADDEDEPKAALRLAVVKLWIATMAMLALQAYSVVTVCMIALLWRRRWTAVLAGLGSMVLVLVTFQGGEVTLETDPLEIAVGVAAGYQWFRSGFQPWWQPRVS
jgi:hypothetical protein